MADCTVGDILTIDLEMGEDISAATTLQMKILRPDGTLLTKTATAKSTDASVAQTTTTATDINGAGKYTCSGYAVFSDADDVESPEPFVFYAVARLAAS